MLKMDIAADGKCKEYSAAGGHYATIPAIKTVALLRLYAADTRYTNTVPVGRLPGMRLSVQTG
jgi:hypothetical protein